MLTARARGARLRVPADIARFCPTCARRRRGRGAARSHDGHATGYTARRLRTSAPARGTGANALGAAMERRAVAGAGRRSPARLCVGDLEGLVGTVWVRCGGKRRRGPKRLSFRPSRTSRWTRFGQRWRRRWLAGLFWPTPLTASTQSFATESPIRYFGGPGSIKLGKHVKMLESLPDGRLPERLCVYDSSE